MALEWKYKCGHDSKGFGPTSTNYSQTSWDEGSDTGNFLATQQTVKWCRSGRDSQWS